MKPWKFLGIDMNNMASLLKLSVHLVQLNESLIIQEHLCTQKSVRTTSNMPFAEVGVKSPLQFSL